MKTPSEEYVRAAGLDAPINTVDASNRYGLVSAQITEYYGASQRGFDVSEPMHTAADTTIKGGHGRCIVYATPETEENYGNDA